MQAVIQTCRARPARAWFSRAGRWRRVLDAWFELTCAFILLAFNAPLFRGGSTEALAFNAAKIVQGEWWRVVTHPLVHVSWYHLLLDGGAFLMLSAELRHWSRTRQLGVIAVCGIGSVMAAVTSPLLWLHGLSGLSGIAHGLMVITSLEMIDRTDPWECRIGWWSLAAVLIKAGFEAAAGHVLLSFLHFGLMGTPIAVCHAGGALGGLVFSLVAQLRKRLHKIPVSLATA